MFDQLARSSSMTDRYLIFFGGTHISHSAFINSTISVGTLCSTGISLGNNGLNSGKVSLKVMLFILTSKCSHIIDLTGRSEDMKKTLMASKTADDAVGLKRNEGKTTYMLQERGSREWVNNT